jgi:hypothetical protein
MHRTKRGGRHRPPRRSPYRGRDGVKVPRGPPSAALNTYPHFFSFGGLTLPLTFGTALNSCALRCSSCARGDRGDRRVKTLEFFLDPFGI